MNNHIQWRCRHCKKLTAKVLWSLNKWPLCEACYAAAYHEKGALA